MKLLKCKDCKNPLFPEQTLEWGKSHKWEVFCGACGIGVKASTLKKSIVKWIKYFGECD